VNRILNFGLFHCGWLLCVVGAARGHLWLGPAFAAAFLALHLRVVSTPTTEARLIAAAGLFGFTIDTLLASGGVYAFAGTSVMPWLSPPWMVALWMIFATTLNTSMAWLVGRPLLAAMLGAIFGPASYVTGARLGAIEMGASGGLAVIAIVWAIAMPTLLWFRELACRPVESRLHTPACAR
jgi:Protein of unknown function (DUF2878)